VPNEYRNPGRCAICGTPDDLDHDQKPHGFEIAPDPVARSYAELAVAVVTVQEQLNAIARHQIALARSLDVQLAAQRETLELLRTISSLLSVYFE
jgi:hypothetical protein